MSNNEDYTLGQRLLFSFTTKNTAGALADPTTVELRILPPGGAAIQPYTLAGLAVVRDSVGVFHMSYLPVVVTTIAPYFWAFQTTGNDTDTSTDGAFWVRALKT